jgi:2,3-bisphosphoglycerate-dependent phosphoglycerate mutase
VRRLLLVRHGLTEDNRRGRVQGQGGVGLADEGVAQAERLAAWVAETHPAATVVSSDLQRCRETAAPVGQALGTDVVLDVDLRERHFGAWQGRDHADLAATDPDRWGRFCAGADVVEEVGGESNRALAARAVAAFRRLTSSGPDTVLAVSHGGTIWHGLHALLALPPRTLGPVANTGVTEVGFTDDGVVLLAWNQTTHLDAAVRTRPVTTPSSHRQ